MAGCYTFDSTSVQKLILEMFDNEIGDLVRPDSLERIIPVLATDIFEKIEQC